MGKQCSTEGCTNQRIHGRVYGRHGAKLMLFSREGCTSYALKGGVCVSHGAEANYAAAKDVEIKSSSPFEGVDGSR